MLGLFTLFMMAGVGYAHLREGLLTSLTMLCNVLIAGVITFNFFEPLADVLGPILRGMFLAGYEDLICMLGIFCISLAALRLATNTLAHVLVQFPPAVQRPGGFIVGMIVGYLTAGFLLCVLQTIPWHQNFLGFDYEYKSGPENALRHYLPPDRVWLALMHRAGAYTFANQEDEVRARDSSSPYDRYKTFDQEGEFELRYARFRRHNDKGMVETYGE